MTAKELLEVMADLEARIAKIYERFATEFREVVDIGDLWVGMGREEMRHADHLSLAAGRAPSTPAAASVVEHMRRLETMVSECEREVAHPVKLQQALGVTEDLEAAESAHLHGALDALGDWAGNLLNDPVMQHRQRGLLDHAISVFGTPPVQERLARRRSSE